MRFVDAHIHLSDPEYHHKVGQIVEEAKRSNVVALVSNSLDLETSMQSLRLSEEHAGLVYAALAVHPWSVKQLSPNEPEQTQNLILRQRNNLDRVVAVGEIGLDFQYAKTGEFKDLQLKVFHGMLWAAAEKTSLPIIVHSKFTALHIMSILSSYRLRAVLFHWFSGPVELLPQLVERGYYISEGPPSVYSSKTQEIVEKMPITSLLTETDGPVRFWGPFKNKTTTPAFIPQVVRAIADIKGMSEVDVAEQIFRNFTTFFRVGVS